MHYTVGAQAQPFEPNDHSQTDRDLQRDFGKSGIRAINIASIDEMADLEKDEQHGQQDRAPIDQARGNIIGPPAKEIAGGPKSRCRNAVAVKQPIEDGRGAHIATDNTRFPCDAGKRTRAPTAAASSRNAGKGCFSDTQAMPGTMSASPTVSHPRSSAMVSENASAAMAPAANTAPAAASPGRGGRLPSVSVAMANNAARRSAMPEKGIETAKPAIL